MRIGPNLIHLSSTDATSVEAEVSEQTFPYPKESSMIAPQAGCSTHSICRATSALEIWIGYGPNFHGKQVLTCNLWQFALPAYTHLKQLS